MTAPVPAPPSKRLVVFDTSLLVAWLTQANQQWPKVEKLLRHPRVEPILPAPALTEAIYIAKTRGNSSSSQVIADALVGQGIIVEPLLYEDSVIAGDYIAQSRQASASKPDAKSLSLGDGLILSIAARLGAAAATFDSHWFDVDLKPKVAVLNAWKVQ